MKSFHYFALSGNDSWYFQNQQNLSHTAEYLNSQSRNWFLQTSTISLFTKFVSVSLSCTSDSGTSARNKTEHNYFNVNLLTLKIIFQSPWSTSRALVPSSRRGIWRWGRGDMCGVVERMPEVRLIRSQVRICSLLVAELWAHPVTPKPQFPQL